ncbi:MAG TPA: ATP-binding protein [Feifaniaceae bacterium]|nr:ATP-binding protein [Feifaniaceae bacterium]
MKSAFLKKILLFLMLTLLSSSLLTAVLFTYTSRNVFAGMKARDMVPAAMYISDIVAQYQRGEISPWAFERLLNNDQTIWDASVLIFDAEGKLLARTRGADTERMIKALSSYLPDTLSGKSGVFRLVTAELGIVVGAPVSGVDAKITGAVFLTKPLNEVNAALSGLNTALLISLLLVSLATILPAYFVSKSLAKPLLQMSQAARAMAFGDYTVKAYEKGNDEIGVLGRSLNELSAALSKTIGDLVLERNRLRNVLNGLKEGIVAVDETGYVTHCNPAAERLLHADAGNAQSALSRLEALWPEIGALMRRGDSASRTVTAEGVQLRVTVTQLAGQQEKRAGAVTMIQDVTEEMRLEQTRRDYVANVSHELRTPIASIRSLADALNDGLVKTDEDKTRYYGYILRESMRLSRLINDLLELSRLQSGGVALEKRAFRLDTLLQELSERFEAAAGDSGLTFSLELPDGGIPAYSNEDRVEQVLVALLDNAIKYASDEGRVTLKAEQTAEGFTLSVCNTGHIPEEHLNHLFERFYKADTAHAEQGTGLGLAIAREIMSLLGERIWAENRDGEACFRFTLTKG